MSTKISLQRSGSYSTCFLHTAENSRALAHEAERQKAGMDVGGGCDPSSSPQPTSQGASSMQLKCSTAYFQLLVSWASSQQLSLGWPRSPFSEALHQDGIDIYGAMPARRPAREPKEVPKHRGGVYQSAHQEPGAGPQVEEKQAGGHATPPPRRKGWSSD